MLARQICHKLIQPLTRLSPQMLKPFLVTAPRWYAFTRAPSSTIPLCWKDWLEEPASLTRRLQSLARGGFSVKVIDEYWGVADRSECRALNIRYKQWVYIREVELWGRGQCWVKAKTLIPKSSFRGSLASLKTIGSRPLGERLFSDPKISRGKIEIARFSDSGKPVWARRSLFSLGKQPLLVIEVFMPCLLEVQ